VQDAEGNIVPPLPSTPSAVHIWSSIADQNDLVADMFTRFARADNWFDIYKTWEVARKLVGGEKSKTFKSCVHGLKSEDMKRAADYHRHANRPPPPAIMELEEARSVLKHIVHNVMKHVAIAAGPPKSQR
jgi:hypothetical protein